MKNGILAIVGLAGIAILAKKAQEKKSAIKSILNDFEIDEKTPFGVADKIRTMSDEDYQDFKSQMKNHFGKCCKTSCCKD